MLKLHTPPIRLPRSPGMTAARGQLPRFLGCWLLLLVALLGGVACRAGVHNVRRAKDHELCVQRLLVAVETIEELETPLLHDPLEQQLERQGAEVDVIGSSAIANLRDPSIAGPLVSSGAEALLVIDIQRSTLLTVDFVPSATTIDYKLSLYEFTQARDLVEIWKARAFTKRVFSYNRALESAQAEVMADDVASELEKSGFLWPCQPVETD